MAVIHKDLIVFLHGLTLEAGIGVHAHEQGRLQQLVLDVSLGLAPGPVTGLDDTVNYEAVAAAARDIIAVGHIDLVEEFAESLARTLLDHPRVRSARVRVAKPGALGGETMPGCEVELASAG